MNSFLIKIIFLFLQFFGLLTNIIANLVIKNEWELLKTKIVIEYNSFKLIQSNIPSAMLTSVLIIGEDHRFLFHRGVDPIAIIRAIWKRVVYSKREGASTIEQQLVRVISNHYENNLTRKIKEILFASLLYKTLNKNAIASLYLHKAYFGWKMNGLQQACNRLNISSKTKDIYEAANIVARLKYPESQICSAQRSIMIQNRVKYIIDKYYRIHHIFITQGYGNVLNSFKTDQLFSE